MRIMAGLLVLLIACDGGSPGTEPQPQFGSVRGTVVEDGGDPVGGVTVQLARQGHSTRSATSTAAGVFTFGTVQTGSWTVSATPPAGFEAAGNLSTSVQVSADTEATVAPFELRRTGTAPTAATVNMVDNAFAPSSVTIAAGGIVTWVNTGSAAHNSTGAGGAWMSADLVPGATFERQFPASGTFSYQCTLHPGMTGTVIVQ
ncbi:MAG TPA: carboxypeptidase regulatory-like domain-containing protein [Longimicrobiales bacterium]|nr:carboxypeptidase regulatory-like domain-containing protein [Longimicrobiales bacterium]